MRTLFIRLKSLGVLVLFMSISSGLFVGCNDSDDFTSEIDVVTTHIVDHREQIFKIPVASNTDWVLIKESCRWCVPDKSNGSGNDTLILRIAENIDYKERKFSIGIGNTSASKVIQITQQAATEEYHYKLPVIFHILYDYPSNPEQNVAADVIVKTIEAVNAYYRNPVNSVDMNLEFVLATHDPQGNLLQEPGIERIYSNSPTETSGLSFLDNLDNTAYIWDLNRYINIFLFPFIENGLFGASTLPYTVGYDPLVGLHNGDVYWDYPVKYPHSIVLNNYYVLTENYELKIPDVHITLTHELGHYLGLFHVFNEDYCDDTETYDRDAYDKLRNSLEWWLTVTGIEDMVKRTSLTGSPFVSYNLMDYEYSYLNQFTTDQRMRVRHVLENSPLIPGPKHTDYRTRSTRSTEIPKQRFSH